MASLHPVDTVTADELKTVLQNLCFAAGGCMKNKPSRTERQRLRLVLGAALKALKTPVCEISQVSPYQSDPVRLVADYVEQGGNWQNLIAAITSRGRSGMTRQNYLTPTKDKHHENRIQH